jgi:N-acetyl-anhydromuramyl-L-alanine amidase AmpD
MADRTRSAGLWMRTLLMGWLDRMMPGTDSGRCPGGYHGGRPMLTLDKDGMVLEPRVRAARQTTIERGDMAKVNGIIVHQTGGSSAASSLSSYKNANASGAHLLIDRDGTIYQTASFYKRTWHVGKLKARCVVEQRCTPVELAALKKFNPAAEHKQENTKQAPARYPSNDDSVGIELVGKVLANGVYEAVTADQNSSLAWLVSEIQKTLGVPVTEVFRHPDVSRKNPSEAQTAKW